MEGWWMIVLFGSVIPAGIMAALLLLDRREQRTALESRLRPRGTGSRPAP